MTAANNSLTNIWVDDGKPVLIEEVRGPSTLL